MKNINPAIEDMISQKKLSVQKIELLASLKEYVDRVSGTTYLPEVELVKMEEQFGVKPDIITWGDYFQSQVAGDHWEKTDAEFEKISETIYYDLVASVMIFEKKGDDFINDIETQYYRICEKEQEDMTPEDQEIYHLKILKDYYTMMQLRISAFSSEDFDFFKQYSDGAVV
ncbi:MAG: hypothetical protein ABUK01_08255 [Leptospirales bacterium]